MSKAFDGIKVIDASHVLAGPFAAYQLAVLGADVIKVDRPDDPDQARTQGANRSLNDAFMGTMFLAQGSNKKSIAVDLKTPQGRDILKKLIAEADVFIENYRPGAFEAMGLGYEDFKKINPRLIYCSISAFGANGPRRCQTGYDNVFQAMSGIMGMTGTAEVAPLKAGAPVIDYASGAMTAFAISAALFHREHTQQGQKIDASMLDAAMILMSSHVTAYTAVGKEPKPDGNRSYHATLGAFETKEGMIMLGAANLRQHRKFWQVLGRDDMIKADNYARFDDYEREYRITAEIMLTQTADYWEHFFQDRGVPAGRVRTMSEALEEPQIKARGVFHHHQAENLPEIDTYKVPVTAFSMSDGGPEVVSPPPRLGEHTKEILATLGFSPDKITRLYQESAVY